MKKQSNLYSISMLLIKNKKSQLKWIGPAIAGIVAICSSHVYAHDNDDDAEPVTAVAKIRGCTPDFPIKGKAFLMEKPSDEGVKEVHISFRVRGLGPGKHAVHIHETGACEPCGNAGGHFDPGPAGFTSPDGNHPYHSGDLINIEARGRKGRGKLDVVTTRVTLSPGPLSIFDDDGSAFIIHVNPDTYCPGGEVAGCAGGGRAACGIIVPKSAGDDDDDDDDY